MAGSIPVQLRSPCKQPRRELPFITQPTVSRPANRLSDTTENLPCLRARSLKQRLLRIISSPVPKRAHGLQVQRALWLDLVLLPTGNLTRGVELPLLMLQETETRECW